MGRARFACIALLLAATAVPAGSESSGNPSREPADAEYRASLTDDLVPGRVARSSRGWYDYESVPDGKRTVGRIAIPRVGVDAKILVGVDDWTLRRGVGFFPDTALPHQQGNTALAAHRGTDFWGLRKIKVGDEITVSTEQGRFRYVVEGTKVIAPSDLSVLEPTEGSALTLITCYPFNFKGNAPQRFVVRARPRA